MDEAGWASSAQRHATWMYCVVWRGTPLRVQPSFPDAEVHLQRRVELEGRLHLLAHDLGWPRPRSRGPRTAARRGSSARVWSEARVAQGAVAGDHRDLDDVGGGALDDRVHRQALASERVWNWRERSSGIGAAAAEQRFDVTVRGRLGDRLLDERAGPPGTGQVALDVLGRLVVRDLELLRQPVSAEPVDDAEVDGLRRERSPGPTSSGDSLRTSAAVAAWTSSPRSKISFSTCSPATWARMRSSTCE